MLELQSKPHCSALAAACGLSRLGHHAIERCSSRFWIVLDYMPTSALDPESAGVGYVVSPGRGNCKTSPLLWLAS